MTAHDEIIEVPVRLEREHPIMQKRDHHIMEFLRAQASDTNLGCITVRLPAAERLWQDAFELGIGCGTAIRTRAEQAKPPRKRQPPQEDSGNG